MLEDQLTDEEDWEKAEVNNYRNALKLGTERIDHGYPLTERLIRELHPFGVNKNARGSTDLVGEYRRVQNFIGLTNDIKDAQYIPPEPQKVPEYMQTLEQYINGNPYTGEHMNSLHL